MADKIIDRAFYDSIVHFDESDEAKEYYYSVMNTVTETDGTKDTVRNRILRDYSMLFCDELGTVPGQIAIEEDVEKTADRLYLGSTGFDPRHWYRMQHRFPVIDEDNYDRFAALVIAALAADDFSEIYEIKYIERGYEDFPEKLRKLGAHIEKIDTAEEKKLFMQRER